MTKNKCLILLAIFYSISTSLVGGESWLQSFKNLLFVNATYTRHQLYNKLKNENNIDERVAENIKNNQDDYLEMIEELILKREHNGSKEGKIMSVSKIGYGIAQLGILIIGCLAMEHYDKQYPSKYTVPAALLLGGLGLKNLYKGIFYKSRMEQKLERDKLARRVLREITNQI